MYYVYFDNGILFGIAYSIEERDNMIREMKEQEEIDYGE